MGILQDMPKIDVSWLMGRSATLPPRRQLRRLFPKRILFAAALVAAFPCLLPQAVGAQTLDQAIANQLNNDCAVLTGGGSAAGLSTALNSICAGSNGTSAGGASGGATGASQSLGATVENRRQDRLEGKPTGNQATFNLPSGLGLFISGNVEALDRDKTTFGDGFDSTVLGAAIGGDYRFNDRLLAGGAFTYTNRNGDFDGGGDFSTNSWGLLAYGSLIPMPAMFLDLTLGYTGHSYLVDRPVSYVEGGSGDSLSGRSSSNAAGNELLIRAFTGYDHTIGNATIGPRVGMNYSRLSIDSYTESGGGGLALSYDNQTIQSLQITVGLQASAAISTSYGVWVPQATADYVHEFENDQRSITVQFEGDQRTPAQGGISSFSFENDKPDRNFFNFGVGTVLVLPNGIQPFANFHIMAGHSQFDNYGGTIGVRIEGG